MTSYPGGAIVESEKGCPGFMGSTYMWELDSVQGSVLQRGRYETRVGR